MDTPPPPDEIQEMREELHRLLDRLPAEAVVALWQFVWTWLRSRPPSAS